jgi:hypothetical protein
MWRLVLARTAGAFQRGDTRHVHEQAHDRPHGTRVSNPDCVRDKLMRRDLFAEFCREHVKKRVRSLGVDAARTGLRSRAAAASFVEALIAGGRRPTGFELR